MTEIINYNGQPIECIGNPVHKTHFKIEIEDTDTKSVKTIVSRQNYAEARKFANWADVM